MDRLYSLTFYTQAEGGYRDGFRIGFFRTYDEAKKTELFYRKEVTGFKDYPCDAEIKEIPIIGPINDSLDCIYLFEGWNVNEDYDETDIIESHCYTDRFQAEIDYQKSQEQFSREEWVLNQHIIGELYWQEGFVRDPD